MFIPAWGIPSCGASGVGGYSFSKSQDELQKHAAGPIPNELAGLREEDGVVVAFHLVSTGSIETDYSTLLFATQAEPKIVWHGSF
jgi:hypothetical protein